MEKVIYWELYKKFKFDHTNVWYINNPESVLENEMYEILWNFEIQTELLIWAGEPDLMIVNKKKITIQKMEFAVPVDHRIKLKESEKRDQYLGLARELKSYGT